MVVDPETGGRNNMKKITQSIEYEGLPFHTTNLHLDLQAWHRQHPFSTGLDWEFQQFWAVLDEESAFAFCVKHPEYADRFKDV